jgi:hypothetical protein
MTEATVLISLKKENQILSAIGLAVLTVILALASFNTFELTDSLSQEFLLVLVIFFILLVSARLYFVHTVMISQLGLIYISNKREKIIPWAEIGGVEVIGQPNMQRHQRLIIKNKNGKLMRGFPTQLLLVDIHHAAELIKKNLQ